MTPLEELAAKLRTFWLRDIGASSASVDSSAAADGSVALARTLFVPAAGGLVGINQIPSDPYALDVVGHARIAGDLYARAGNAWNMGADGTPWGAIYASELHVGNLIAENKIATTGGRILVSPSTKVILAMTTGATTIDVAANTLTSGDRIYLESTGKLEWMAVTSGSTAVTGGYRYSVTRNLNGAGAQTWSAGDAVVNTGQTGQGFIDLYSRYGIPANGQTSTTRQGPTIVGNVRTGSTYDAIRERWAVGNLKGLYDYAATAYGMAAGDPTAAWLGLDATNGLRIMQAAAARAQLTAAGVFTINDSAGAPVFTFNASSGAEFTLPLTLAATGGIYQGTGTFASPTTGLKIFNSGGIGKIAGYNTGTVQWYADTDGRLYAGAGAVWLDSTGVGFTLGTSYAAGAALKWGANVVIYGMVSAGVNRLYLTSAQPGTGTIAETNVRAEGGSSGGGGGQINLVATGNGASGYLTLYSTGAHVLRGSLGFYGSSSGTATVQAAAVAGTPTLTLPTATGTLALTSDIPTTAVATKTADYTLTDSDGTILADCSAGDIVMALPPVSGRTGRKFTVKRIVDVTNKVYIIGNGIEKVEGAWYGVYLQYAGQDSAMTFQCDGVQWRGVSAYGSSPASAAPVCDLQQPAASSLTSGVSTIDFGTVVVGSSSAAKTFTIQDDGRPNLGITSAAVGGGNSGDFPVNTASMAAVVAYNATTTFAVTFTPAASGARSTTLTVTSTAGVFTVTLTGTATASYSWIPWDVFVMASIASGAQPGIGGENSVSWFNSAT